jgi:putative hemolysin
MKKIVTIIVALVLISTGFYMVRNNILQKEVVVEKPTGAVINSVIFTCADAKTIQSIFFSDKVELILSDKRTMLLSQAISASGARYVNSDESFVFWNKGNTAFVDEKGIVTFKDCIEGTKGEEKTPVAQIGNPASLNCTKVGGTLSIEKRGAGGEYGLCYFEDNRACEEWALMRGECPVGGVKTTGYDTVDQKYCAWVGGKTLAVPNSTCTFKNGKVCTTKAFYDGSCNASQ